MPKVTQQYRDARREQILAAARRCFLRDGFDATSMRDLFTEAKLSSGAVYLYFASKDEVIMAIAEENMRDMVALVHEAAAAGAGRSVGEVVADVLDIVQAKHAEHALGGLAVLSWTEALRNPGLAAQFDDLLGRMRTDLAAVIREHPSEGADGISPDALASLLISIVPGFILQLTLLGPAVVTGVPEAIRQLW